MCGMKGVGFYAHEQPAIVRVDRSTERGRDKPSGAGTDRSVCSANFQETPMPAGRPVNYDAKINRLVAELRKALVAREVAKIEASVSKHMGALVNEFDEPIIVGNGVVAPTRSAPTDEARTDEPARAATRHVRKGRSAASRQAQAAKMKAYWKARKASEAKGAAGSMKKGGARSG